MSVERRVPLTLGAFARWCGSRSAIGERTAARQVGLVWNDSREVGRNDIFVAIKTERDDGHRYVQAAFDRGALAAVVARDAEVACDAAHASRLIRVADPVAAVQRCARSWRRALGLLVIALTGSSGKTTTRSFISTVLGSAVPVGGTHGNLNNHIGVPLSILRLTGAEYAAVLEMGANHVGEISPLSTTAEPDIALITNIGYAHVGLFGSLANTTRTKLEIIDGLNRSAGFLLINGDDSRLLKAAAAKGVRTVSYGFGRRCDVVARITGMDNAGTCFEVDGRAFRLSMQGRHYVYAALPAIYLGRRCGVGDRDIAEALAGMKPVELRGTVERRKGVSFIVDCYNANPSSMQAALTMLCESVPAGRRVAVVGDMRELGLYSARLHRQLGRQLAASGVRAAVAVGEYAATVRDGAVAAGMSPRAIVTVGEAAAAAGALRSVARKGDTVLLKASRLVGLEKVLEQF